MLELNYHTDLNKLTLDELLIAAEQFRSVARELDSRCYVLENNNNALKRIQMDTQRELQRANDLLGLKNVIIVKELLD
jgi:hypothetical protein